MREPRLRQRHRAVVALGGQAVDHRSARITETEQLRHLVVGLAGGIVTRAPETLVCARRGDAVEAGVAARDDQHHGRQRHLPAFEHQRFDVTRQMVHRHERHALRPGQRLGEREPDQQRSDQPRALRHGNESRRASRPKARPPRRRARPRRRCRGCAAEPRAPAPRRPRRDESRPATRRRSNGRATAARRRRTPRRWRPTSRRTTSRCRVRACVQVWTGTAPRTSAASDSS